MSRKPIIKVILSQEQRQILKDIVQRFGTSESEVLRTAFMTYAKDIGALHFERR